MLLSVTVSTTDFDSVSLSSNLKGASNKHNMKKDKQKDIIIEMMQEDEKLGLYPKGPGIISQIGKFIDSAIPHEYILILAYLIAIGLLLWWSTNVSL